MTLQLITIAVASIDSIVVELQRVNETLPEATQTEAGNRPLGVEAYAHSTASVVNTPGAEAVTAVWQAFSLMVACGSVTVPLATTVAVVLPTLELVIAETEPPFRKLAITTLATWNPGSSCVS